MTARNLPASLTRARRHPASPDNGKPNEPAKQAEPGRPPDKIVIYLAVPDPRVAQLLKQRARVFASRRSRVPLELHIFTEPNLPNVALDDLVTLAALTEVGEVDGLDVLSITPEDLPT